MTKLRKEDIKQEVFDLYDDYAHNKIQRREFIEKLSLCQPKSEIDKINAPLLLQFAGLDERVNAGWPAYEAKLKANNKAYQAHFYPDVNHGFHNTTTPRYNKEAATLAWTRTINFFKDKLN